jgi:hypothetical protein
MAVTAVDNDFFAAPTAAPPTQATSSAHVPIARPPQSSPRSSGGLVWIVGGVVLVALAAAAVLALAGTGVAKRDAKALDRIGAAHDAAIQSDLLQVAMRERAYFAEHGQYALAQEVGGPVVTSASGTIVTATYNGEGFCLHGAHARTKNVYYYSSEDGLLPLGQTCS